MSTKRRGNVVALEYDVTEDDESMNDQSDVDSEVLSTTRSSPRENNSSGKESHGNRGTRARSSSKRPCLNRNALLARENRRRKKEYVEKIENKLSHYKRENENLANTIQRQGIDLKRLKGEVSYLRNVINNNSSITNLLRSMNETLSMGKSRNEVTTRNGHSTRDWRNGRSGQVERGGKRSERLSLAESDHTYTSMGDGSSFEDSSHYPLDHDDNYTSGKDSFHTDQLGLDLIDDPFDRLPRFDENLFDSLEDTFNYSRGDLDDSQPDCSTKLFDNLQNSGVCLHVNSGRISLEFCSICHLNSINASE